MDTSTKYRPGDRVQVRIDYPGHHFRTPLYIQGKTGTIVALCGAFLNPESLAHGGSGLPEKHLYRVEFAQNQVWDGTRARRATNYWWTSTNTGWTRQGPRRHS